MAATRHDIVHDDADGPHVYTFGVLVLEGHFWRHVNECTHVLIVARLGEEVALSKAKVYYLNRTEIVGVVQQNVGSFQITVDDPLVVEIANSLQNGFHDLG